MGKRILDTEAAYIRMVANRVLRLRREAETRGEPYRDMYKPIEVVSGYRAKIRHDPAPHGYETIVEVWPQEYGKIDMAECTELASELLAHPAKLREHDAHTPHLEFVADVKA